MKKKFLSMVMVLAMLLSMIPFSPMTAYAEEDGLSTDVCKIGSAGYESLSDALAAAVSGDTISLLKNIEYTDFIYIKDKALTLDLNGFDLNLNNTSGDGLWVENGSWNLTGEGEFNVTSKYYAVYAFDGGSATVTNVTSNGDGGWSAAVASGLGSTITVLGNSVAEGTEGKAIYSADVANIVVFGDAIATGYEGKAVYAHNGNVTVYGDTLTSGSNSFSNYATNGGNILIKGNAESTGYGSYTVCSDGENSSIEIWGNVTGTAIGVYCRSSSSTLIHGNVTGTQGYGIVVETSGNVNVLGDVFATGGAGASVSIGTVTIEGSITASPYLILYSETKNKNDFIEPTTKLGYRTYNQEDSIYENSTVWVAAELPFATNVAINGSVIVGETLSGEYDFNGTTESETTYRWLADAGESELAIFDTLNIYAVDNNPYVPAEFTISEATLISRIYNYHWNYGSGAASGTIALREAGGTLYGPWDAIGKHGNLYWEVNPYVELPAGTYTVIDSSNETWANNFESGYRGMTQVFTKSYNGAYSAISGATDSNYALTSDELGKKIKFEVTLRDSEGISGSTVSSAAVGPVTAGEPIKTNWIEYVLAAGQYPFGGGDGSSPELAYEISTPYQLAQFAYNVNSGNRYENKYIVLTSDINLTGKEWTPIGKNYGARFEGTFSGDGHSIFGLTITKSNGAEAYGLFGYNGKNGTVADLSIASGEITFTSYPGADSFAAVVGYNLGLVDNCINKIDVNITLGEYDWGYAGGIVGMGESDTRDYVWSGRISNCRNEGDITLDHLGSVGGIIGTQMNGNNHTYIKNCSNTGDIIGGDNTEVGGIAGRCGNGWTDCLINCYNTGAVASGVPGSTVAYVGGIIGYQYATHLANCYNTGTVTNYGGFGNTAAGGIIGYSYGYIYNVYNVGQVSGPSGNSGGITGSGYDAYSFDNCFYLDTSALGAMGSSNPAGTYFLTSEQMKGLAELTINDFGPANGALLYALNEGRSISADNPDKLYYWSSDTGEGNNGYPILSDVEKYVISFNSKGGSTVAAQTLNAGSSISSVPNITLTGSTFSGWFTSQSGGNKINFPYTPTAHIILYAQWSQGSSSSGGSGAFAPSVMVTTNNSGDATINSTKVKTEVISGNAKINITNDIVKALLDKSKATGGTGKEDLIKVVIDTQDNILKIQASVPQSEFKKISSETDAKFAVESTLISIVFDWKAVDTISSTASGGNVVITAECLADFNGRPVFDLAVTNGGKTVSDFKGGHATVTIPYTLLPDENPNAVVVYYLADDGTLKTVRGHYDAALKSVVFKTTHFSNFVIGYNSVLFADVKDNAWYKNAIDFIAARGITSGIGENKYGPDENLTRAQFVVLLMNAYQINTQNQGDFSQIQNFTDAGNTYYTDYLMSAKALGIVNGVGNNLFAPEKEITRQEMFVMLNNALKVIDEVPAATVTRDLSGFDDADQVADWASQALSNLVKAGIVSGSNSKLNPISSTTRAEIAQVLYNLLSK